MLAGLARKRSWLKSPSIPVGLEGNASSGDEKKLDEQTQNILKLIHARDYNTAIVLLKKRIEQNPRDYVGWWLQGDCSFAKQDFVNAQQAYTVCIALQPNTAIAYLNRGMARYSAASYESAANDYAKVASLAPSWNVSRFNRALALQKIGRVDDAIDALDKAIESGYVNVSVYRLRAELFETKGETEVSKLDYAKALQCEPKTDQHWVDRGLIRLGSNPAQAAADFERALEANPISVDAHQKLAYVYSELLRDPEMSLKHSNRLVELAPWQPTHLAGRAVLHARAGRTDAALDDLALLETMRLQDPMVVYQAACGYSLLAGNAAKQGQTPATFSKPAFRLLIRSVGGAPSILAIAMTDPDVQWMREQPQFQEIAQAVTTLELKPR